MPKPLGLICQIFVQPINFLVFFVLFTPVLLLFKLWKQIIRLLLKIQYGASVEIMGPCDAISAHKPAPSKEGLIHAVFHVRGPLSLAEIRRRVFENLVDAKDKDGVLKHPRLRRWIQSHWGLYCWRNVEKFDYDYHVDYYRDEATNKPHCYETEEEQMHLVQKIINSDMFKRGVSPWQIFLVQKADQSEGIVVLRSHHCMFDGGAAFMVILPAIADEVNAEDVFGNVKKGKFAAKGYKLLGMLCVPYLLSR